MSEFECNNINAPNDSTIVSERYHTYNESEKFKPVESFIESKPQKEKCEPKETKKPKAKSKLLSLMMSAVAVTVVAVPQIENYTSVNMSYYTIESTADTIFYQFDFFNKERDNPDMQDGQYEEMKLEYDNLVVTVYNDFMSDSQQVDGMMIEYTVEDLKPNMEYYIKITNNGTLIFKKSITTNYEYYYCSGSEISHGFNPPEVEPITSDNP